MPETAPITLPVSVIVPTYNRRDTLARALRSINDQHGAVPAEVIVVDDHSEDGSDEVARAHGARVIRHERNRGAAASRNTGVAAATQPWLALLDSDDEWLPGLLSSLWPLRASHVLIAGTCVSCFDGSDQPPEYAGTPRGRTRVLRSPAALIPHNQIPASGVIVRRDAVLAAGGYNTGLRYAEDWDLWIRVLEQGTGLLAPPLVTRYHRHDGQKSSDPRGPTETHDRIVASYATRPWFTATVGHSWRGLRLWEALERSVRARRPVAAARAGVALLAHPARPFAVIRRRMSFWRTQRRSRELPTAVASSQGRA